MVERRRTTRRETPLFVLLEHPQLGSVETFVGDLSEDGVFVVLRDSGLSSGARMRLTPRPVDSGRHVHAPTLQVEVRRVSDTGLGLTFASSNARMLWRQWLAAQAESPGVQPAERRLYLALLVTSEAGAVLLGRSDRRWQLPAIGLQERGRWRDAVLELAEQLQIDPECARTLEVVELLEVDDTDADVADRMHVVVRLILPGPTEECRSSGYEALRWVDSQREIRELTFAHADEQGWLLRWLDLQSAAG